MTAPRAQGALVGRMIGGAYTLTRLIGAGAMGEVYEAVKPSGESVALKILHPAWSNDREIVARFQRESTLASRVQSPHVARVLSSGMDRRRRLWIAYELLRGATLEARLVERSVFPIDELAPIGEQILTGLDAIHSAGVVHRDIKPANIFLHHGDTGERACILDFGISRSSAETTRSGSETSSLTTAGAIIGTPAYMAPEMVGAARRVDGRADLYSFGVIVFRALTGRLPYPGDSVEELLAYKVTRPPMTLREASGLRWPSAIQKLLDRALAFEPERRQDTATALIPEWRRASAANGYPATLHVMSATRTEG